MGLKPIAWVASSKKDLLAFPADVVRDIGHSLWLVQLGDTPVNSKPLKGFGGASVLEIIENDECGAFRAVYTVRFEDAIYVLHCFQKKSRSGISTPQDEIELIRKRLKVAEDKSKEWIQNKKKKL